WLQAGAERGTSAAPDSLCPGETSGAAPLALLAAPPRLALTPSISRRTSSRPGHFRSLAVSLQPLGQHRHHPLLPLQSRGVAGLLVQLRQQLVGVGVVGV